MMMKEKRNGYANEEVMKAENTANTIGKTDKTVKRYAVLAISLSASVLATTVAAESGAFAAGTRAVGVVASIGSAGSVGSTANLANVRTAGMTNAVGALFDTTESIEETAVATVSASDVVTDEWADRLMADVDEALVVRKKASKKSDIIGKMRVGDVATVIGEKNGWYKIKSGNVKGFVNAKYVVLGEAAKELSEEVCKTYATSSVEGLRVRTDASEDAGVLTTVGAGDAVEVDSDVKTHKKWVAVKTANGTGYVSADYVTVETAYGAAITVEEEQELIAAVEAAKQAAEEAAAAQAVAALAQAAEQAEQAAQAVQTTETTTVQQAAVTATYDDVTYLAAIIQHEAGVGSYEGMLAVGAVVCNRVRSGSFPNTVYDVINQPYQFISTSSASMQSILQNPNAACVQAAQEALAGVDPTGGCLSFRSARSGHAGVVIGGNVFF